MAKPIKAIKKLVAVLSESDSIKSRMSRSIQSLWARWQSIPPSTILSSGTWTIWLKSCGWAW